MGIGLLVGECLDEMRSFSLLYFFSLGLLVCTGLTGRLVEFILFNYLFAYVGGVIGIAYGSQRGFLSGFFCCGFSVV